MRPGAPDLVLNGSAGYACVVSSWRGGRLLGLTRTDGTVVDSVPVAGGNVSATVSQTVPERLTLRVPRFADGVDWLPGSNTLHPLARFGQELSVAIVIGSSVSRAEYETRIGRFLVTDWSYSDSSGEVTVTGAGLLKRVEDDRLPSPLAPRPDGTFVSEARRLLPLGMFAGFDPALNDRACPQSMEWAEDRLGALYEIADAWPARLRTDPWGGVQFLPSLPDIPTPVLSLRDGERGTVVGVDRDDTRSGGYNRVVARSSASGLESVQAVAERTTGPMAVNGPYGAVTRFWSSPLITTTSQAHTAAASMLRSSLLPTRTIPVSCVPDPRIDLDDPVEVVRDGQTYWGWVVGYDLPLTYAGTMRIDVGVSA